MNIGSSTTLATAPVNVAAMAKPGLPSLRQLEKEGVLEMDPADGRAKIIRLTQTGQSRMAETVEGLYHAECRTLQDWTEEEFSLRTQLTHKYIHGLRAQVAEPKQEKT